MKKKVGEDRQTDRQTCLFGVLYNKWYIDHNFQITKNCKQQKIYMAKKLLISYVLEYLLFAVFTTPFFKAIEYMFCY